MNASSEGRFRNGNVCRLTKPTIFRFSGFPVSTGAVNLLFNIYIYIHIYVPNPITILDCWAHEGEERGEKHSGNLPRGEAVNRRPVELANRRSNKTNRQPKKPRVSEPRFEPAIRTAKSAPTGSNRGSNRPTPRGSMKCIWKTLMQDSDATWI